jgi:HK97 gp10 family phage protein
VTPAGLKIDGVPELLKTIDAIAKTLSGEGAAALVARAKAICMQPANAIAEAARANAPVKTGALKAGIFAAPIKDKVGGVVGVHGVEYAAAVEYGTSTTAADPYMRPASNAIRPTFASMMASDLQALIADTAKANAAHPTK